MLHQALDINVEVEQVFAHRAVESFVFNLLSRQPILTWHNRSNKKVESKSRALPPVLALLQSGNVDTVADSYWLDHLGMMDRFGSGLKHCAAGPGSLYICEVLKL